MFDSFCVLLNTLFGFSQRLDLPMGSRYPHGVFEFILDGADHFLDVCVDYLLECIIDL